MESQYSEYSLIKTCRFTVDLIALLSEVSWSGWRVVLFRSTAQGVVELLMKSLAIFSADTEIQDGLACIILRDKFQKHAVIAIYDSLW